MVSRGAEGSSYFWGTPSLPEGVPTTLFPERLGSPASEKVTPVAPPLLRGSRGCRGPLSSLHRPGSSVHRPDLSGAADSPLHLTGIQPLCSQDAAQVMGEEPGLRKSLAQCGWASEDPVVSPVPHCCCIPPSRLMFWLVPRLGLRACAEE